MSQIVKLSLLCVLALASPPALGQSTLGALLDAGAQKLTVDEFNTQLVQRTLIGPTGAGLGIEVIYTSAGTISGTGGTSFRGPGPTVDGDWRSDDAGRICESMRIESSRMTQYNLAPRCQFWFKLGDTYYVAGSDSDRYVKVLPRKLK